MARWAPRRSGTHTGLYQRILDARADHYSDMVARLGGSNILLPIWPCGEPLRVQVWELPPELRHRFPISSTVVVHADDRIEVDTVEPGGDLAPVVELVSRRGPLD